MQKLLKYKYELILAIFLIGFIAFQWKSLFLPYFWDELAYYAKAALYLHDNGLSLLPDGLPPDLSRGHPLLFQFLGGLWFNLFGTTLFFGHLLPLFISISTLLLSYFFAARITSSLYGLLVAITLAIQPVFYVQSTMILPEILVGFLTLLAIYFLIQNKVVISLVFCILLLLTKETSLILPLCIFTYILWSEKDVKKALLYLIPIAILGLFFIIQKMQNGWFFFPFHIEIIAAKGITFLHNIMKSLYFLFVAQYRFVLSVFFFIQVYQVFTRKLEGKEKSFTLISILIILSSILLISSLHLMSRYYLMIIPLYIISSIFGLKNICNSNKKAIWVAPIFLASLISLPSQKTFNMGVDLGYKNCITATHNTHKYLINSELNNKKGFCHFSILRAFSDPRLGYVDVNKEFSLVEDKTSVEEYAIEINPDGWNRDFSHWNHFKLVKKIKEGNFEILIFEK